MFKLWNKVPLQLDTSQIPTKKKFPYLPTDSRLTPKGAKKKKRRLNNRRKRAARSGWSIWGNLGNRHVNQKEF